MAVQTLPLVSPLDSSLHSVFPPRSGIEYRRPDPRSSLPAHLFVHHSSRGPGRKIIADMRSSPRLSFSRDVHFFSPPSVPLNSRTWVPVNLYFPSCGTLRWFFFPLSFGPSPSFQRLIPLWSPPHDCRSAPPPGKGVSGFFFFFRSSYRSISRSYFYPPCCRPAVFPHILSPLTVSLVSYCLFKVPFIPKLPSSILFLRAPS